MPFIRSLTWVLPVTICTSLILSTTRSSFASDMNKRAGELNRTGNLHNSPPADTSAWIDSLKRVIAKKYSWGSGGPAALKSQKRYILANTTLADYYAKKFYAGHFASLAPAEKYYANVAVLTAGTDGDLADDISVIRMRDDGARKLMRLYLSLNPSPVYREKLYKLLRGNRALLRNESAASRNKISKFIFKSTNRFFVDAAPVVPATNQGITCLVNPVYSLSGKTGQGRLNLLDSFATILKANPEKRLKVASLSAVFTMMEQQLLWEISNFAISYLVEKQGIAPDRFLFSYNMEEEAANSYKGMKNLPQLTLSFAEEGEEGPSMVPAPLPHLRQ